MLNGVEGYQALTSGSGAVATTFDVVQASGPDTTTFLHSQLSQDIAGLVRGETRWSFHLTPQGRIIALLRAVRLEDDVIALIVEAGYGEAVRSALERFKIRTKCALDLREGVPSLSMCGRSPTARADGRLVADSGLANWQGFDLVGASGVLDGASGLVDPAVYEAARIEHGLVRNGLDIDERTLPGETGMVALAASFTKGCYVGQELVERIDARGRVNRHLRVIELDGAAVPPRGTSIAVEGTDDDNTGDGRRSSGTLTSAALHPVSGRAIALAYVRREVAPGATVELRWEAPEGPTSARAVVRDPALA